MKDNLALALASGMVHGGSQPNMRTFGKKGGLDCAYRRVFQIKF